MPSPASPQLCTTSPSLVDTTGLTLRWPQEARQPDNWIALLWKAKISPGTWSRNLPQLRRRLHDHERAHVHLGQRLRATHPPLEHPPPLVPEALLVIRHPLAADLPDGARPARRREQVQRDPQEQRPRRVHPEGIRVRRVGKEHIGNELQIAHELTRSGIDIVEGIPADGVSRERIQQKWSADYPDDITRLTLTACAAPRASRRQHARQCRQR